MRQVVTNRTSGRADINDGDPAFQFVVTCLVEEVAYGHDSRRFSCKVDSEPGSRAAKKRTTGLSSRPPPCRLERVMAKSAPFNVAAVKNGTLFSRSQNLCSLAVGRGRETNVDACSMSGTGMGASGSGPWATDIGQMPKIENRTNATARPEDLPGIIGARRLGEQYERGNPTTHEPIRESRHATRDATLRFPFSLKLRAIVHSFAGIYPSVFYFGEGLTFCRSCHPSLQIRHW